MNENTQETLKLPTVEKRLQSLIEGYELEIEEETKNLKKIQRCIGKCCKRIGLLIRS